MTSELNLRASVGLLAILTAFGTAGQQAHAQTTASCTEIPPQSYLPVIGSSLITADQYTRYVSSYWTWGNTQNMEWFLRPYAPGVTWSAGTYEHQHIFYNYDGLSYANAPSGYWDSNQPYPYVDTQAFDSSNEKNITVGSAHARDFGNNPAGSWRYTTRFTNGGGTSSLVKVQSQRGLRVPPTCYSTWCSYACSHQANFFNLVPFQSGLRAPGRVCWRFNPGALEYWSC